MSESERRFQSFDIEFNKTISKIKSDVEKVQKNIVSFKKQTFLQRNLNSFHKKDSVSVATGKVIHNMNPNQISEKFYKRLIQDSEDMVSRLELINVILKGKQLRYDDFYMLFIHAIACVTLNHISKEAIGIVLFLQEKVFTYLVERCEEHLSWLNKKLQENTNTKGQKKIAVDISEEITMVTNTSKSFSTILKQTQAGLKSWRDRPGFTLNRQEVLNVKEVTVNAMDKGQTMSLEIFKVEFKRPSEIALASRYCLFLHEYTKKMIYLFSILQPNSPLPHFIMGRIAMVELNMIVDRYRLTRELMLVQSIHLEFKNVYAFYSKAVKMIPSTTKSPQDFTVLIEFGNLVHYYHQVSKSVIGKPASGDGFKAVIQSAIKAAQTAQESGQSGQLIRDLNKDLSDLNSAKPPPKPAI